MQDSKILDVPVDSLDYRGIHVDFYNDDYGQQVYTYFDNEDIGFGAYNMSYKEDMKYLIDKKLDVITRFTNLRDEGINGCELAYFDNLGYRDIRLTYRLRELQVFVVDGFVSDMDAYIEELIPKCETILRAHKTKERVIKSKK